MPQITDAAAGDIKFVLRERIFSIPVQGASVAISCIINGAPILTSYTTDSLGKVTIPVADLQLGGAYAAAGCTDGADITVYAYKDGYVSGLVWGNGDLGGYSSSYDSSADNYGYGTLSMMGFPIVVQSMQNEVGANIMPTSGTPFAATGNLIISSQRYSSGKWYLVATTTGSGGGILIATSSGYINKSISSFITSSSTEANTYFNNSVSTAAPSQYEGGKFQYGFKVSVSDEVGNSVSNITTATYRGNAPTASSGSTFYWADTSQTSGVLDIRATGYVFATSTNAGFGQVITASSSQISITLGNSAVCASALSYSSSSVSCKGLQTALKVTSVKDELGNNIIPTSGTPISVVGNLTLINLVYNSGAWYVAASATSSGGTLTLSKDGFVDQVISNITTSTSTQKNIAFDGGSAANYNGSALQYALKVTVTKSSDGSPLSGSTVTAGNSNVACAEDSSTGVYYCVVPLSDSGTIVQVVRSGFVTNSVSYTARTASSDSQRTVSLALNVQPVSVSSGGGGGGGGYISYQQLSQISTSTKNPVLSCPTGLTCTPIVTNSVVVPISVTTFSRVLSKGSVGDDVKILQKYLNSKGFIIASVGSGSINQESIFFGNLTRIALAKFQAAKGIIPSTGYFGPKTKAFIQTHP